MKLIQYYLDCLSQASYLIGDDETGRAVVIDPRRDTDQYVRDAKKAGLNIELVIETHFHADFLSGHLELAAKTGAEIGLGPTARTEFDSRELIDRERIALGLVELEILHTPGHTPESICVVVYDKGPDEAPHCVMTGDTLFIGDVGRPDLLSSIGVSETELASQLYDSVQELMKLPESVLVYPGHGAGSSCGKNLSTETWSTIGEQRRTNYALLIEDRDRFVATVTDGQPTVPVYFAHDAILNRKERGLLDENLMPKALLFAEAEEALAKGAIALDCRDADAFSNGHLIGSINVGLAGRYAEFAGSVLPIDVDIVLVVEDGFELEAKNRLARIGLDRVVGFLRDPLGEMASNPKAVQRASRLTAVNLEKRRREVENLQIVDVRTPGEVEQGTIGQPHHIAVSELVSRFDELDSSAPTVVFCAGGYRSSIAASLLRHRGFADVSDLVGGFAAWNTLP